MRLDCIERLCGDHVTCFISPVTWCCISEQSLAWWWTFVCILHKTYRTFWTARLTLTQVLYCDKTWDLPSGSVSNIRETESPEQAQRSHTNKHINISYRLYFCFIYMTKTSAQYTTRTLFLYIQLVRSICGERLFQKWGSPASAACVAATHRAPRAYSTCWRRFLWIGVQPRILVYLLYLTISCFKKSWFRLFFGCPL